MLATDEDHAPRAKALSLLLIVALCSCGDTPPAPAEPDADTTTVTDTPTPAETTQPEPDAAPDVAEDVPEEVVVIEIPDHLGGGFVDLTDGLEDWPPFEVFAGVPEERLWPDVTHGIFVDIDGDGAVEVLLNGVAHEALVRRQLYRYVDGALVPDDDPLNLGTVVMAEDLDGDGHTDLLLIRISDHAVLWGDASGQFNAETKLDPNAVLGDVERTAFHLMDLDGDGWLDLLMRSECGMTPMMRTGPRSFTPRPEVLQDYLVATPYAIGHWQTPDRPLTLLVMGHAQCGFYVGMSLGGRDADGYPVLEPVELYTGHPYDGDPSGQQGLIAAAPMGGAVADLNRDGVLDYFVTLNPDHMILDGTRPWPVDAPMMNTGLRVIPSDNGLSQIGWGVALLDLDRDGLEDVLTAHGNDRSRFEGVDPDPGPQWVTAHYNGGGFHFADATEHLGLERRGGWRALTVGDLDGDHDPDLIVGGLGEAPRVYRNDVESPYHGFALRLQGTTSNRLGIGAQVLVTPEGSDQPQLYTVGGMSSPKVISSPTLYPGLGTATSATVTVTWPSGVTQTVADLAAGELHLITEPEVLRVEPANRHLTAGSDEAATLTITPQSQVSSVTATITHGDGIPSAAVDQGDGSWVITVTPPPTPGFARLELRLDGQPLGIAPRLWWDAP